MVTVECTTLQIVNEHENSKSSMCKGKELDDLDLLALALQEPTALLGVDVSR